MARDSLIATCERARKQARVGLARVHPLCEGITNAGAGGIAHVADAAGVGALVGWTTHSTDAPATQTHSFSGNRFSDNRLELPDATC